ncbi:glycosyltransferase family 4 protein [Burkholderia singularis]|uniref:Capsular polysaccharide glycosyltransferase biosynthesis protein WcbB n=1 Tax=Burkholderia singularis TaxID=1503053 RepID=A0A238HBT3_9BURK|nr:glycosyltransferase family 1 protein [Burkholderia singularis]SMG02884.1 Capsular polysaccharide glycosyltransferase biosynthesis protein WcbB [Burkholderia singularis]
MTPILLDITRLLSRLHAGLIPTGVDRVGLAYIQRYGNGARAVVSEQGFFTIMTEQDSRQIFSRLLSSTHDRPFIRRTVIRAWAALALTRMRRIERGILLHTSHTGMEFPRYYHAMAKHNIRSVFMVHDLIPLTHAEYCRPGVGNAHRRRIHTALRHADGLIANSQATLDSIASEARQARLRLPPSVVAHLAPGIEHGAAQAAPLDKPYFVMLGTIEPRKNHWLMLHVWRDLAERLGDAAPRLVLIGRRGWECENVVDMLERCERLRGLVIEQAQCPDARMRAWLQHAKALLFPSFVEGYGMPLVEALAHRIPVIASDLPVFREIASDIPDYLDPLDGPGWFSKIVSYMQPSSAARDAQLARIEQFSAPTWSTHFEKVDRFIESLG